MTDTPCREAMSSFFFPGAVPATNTSVEALSDAGVLAPCFLAIALHCSLVHPVLLNVPLKTTIFPSRALGSPFICSSPASLASADAGPSGVCIVSLSAMDLASTLSSELPANTSNCQRPMGPRLARSSVSSSRLSTACQKASIVLQAAAICTACTFPTIRMLKAAITFPSGIGASLLATMASSSLLALLSPHPLSVEMGGSFSLFLYLSALRSASPISHSKVSLASEFRSLSCSMSGRSSTSTTFRKYPYSYNTSILFLPKPGMSSTSRPLT
mmetsp:Transcript_15759/g.59980  ORF Transcript_15759/g.59980 Transcript_15759/m.59980 type:complete len:272 (-) Transcript_15759:382-1197(-)